MARGPNGLFPHDLARDVLNAEFRRRSPERYRRLHRIIHDRVVAEIRASSGPDRQHPPQQLMFLHRTARLPARSWTLAVAGRPPSSPGSRRTGRRCWRSIDRSSAHGNAAAGPAVARDQPESLQVVRRRATTWPPSRLGPAAVRLAAGGRRPGRPRRPRPRRTHPAAPARRAGPRGPVFGGARRGRAGSVRRARRLGELAHDVVARPLAWSFIVSTDAEFWGPFFDYLACDRSPRSRPTGGVHAATGSTGGGSPSDRWFDLMSERERTGGTGPAPAAPAAPAAAGPGHVRRRRPRRPCGTCTATTASPATRSSASRLAPGPDGPSAGRAARPTLAGRRRARPRTRAARRSRRVLDRTFVRPAPTQEAAAEVLGPAVQHLPPAPRHGDRRAARPALGGRDRRARAAATPTGAG